MKTWLLLPALWLAQGAWAADTPNMQAGEWEITTRPQMTGMPMQVPPQTVRICITKQDIADGQKTMPTPMGKNNCEFVNRSFSGNKASFKMVCSGEHKATMTGDMTYSGSSYSGKSRMEMAGGPKGNMVVDSEYSARRVGDCKK